METITEQVKSEKPYVLPQNIGTDFKFKREIVWFNAIGFLLLHLAALYGIYLAAWATLNTHIWALTGLFIPGFGVTVGAHRCFSHKAFKAHFSIRLILVILHTIAGQNCLYIWVRDHRQHHKYSDTDADPHNASRGFFFSHIGWLMCRKHPLVIQKGKTIDISDLQADPIVMFQKRYYKILYGIFALAIPIGIPVYCWNENPIISIFYAYFARYLLQLNATWCINSFAHYLGNRPYDKNILPTENSKLSYILLGEGWHNYHHTFPSDYRAGEFGLYYSPSTAIIDILAHLGLVYDLKSATFDMVKKRILNKGDGTHPVYNTDSNQTEEQNDSIHPIYHTVSNRIEEQEKLTDGKMYNVRLRHLISAQA